MSRNESSIVFLRRSSVQLGTDLCGTEKVYISMVQQNKKTQVPWLPLPQGIKWLLLLRVGLGRRDPAGGHWGSRKGSNPKGTFWLLASAWSIVAIWGTNQEMEDLSILWYHSVFENNKSS